MGIRNLNTYVVRDVNNGFLPVNIVGEAENYKKKHGKKPTIVVDLLMMHAHVYYNEHEMILGGRFEMYDEKANYMFRSLKRVDANWVFFVDGLTQPNKIVTCLQRRVQTYRNGLQILNAIDKGLDLSGDLSRFNVPNVTTYFQNFIEIARKYGRVHKSHANENDQNIAYTALETDALAVISEDSDFLIFEGDWHLWSAKSINFRNLTTQEYNRVALRENLGLSAKQMIFLASLGGNDLVKYEMVEGFHRRISSRSKHKFVAMAEIIRQLNSQPPDLSYSDRTYLGSLLFDHSNRYKGMEDLQASMNFYCLIGMKTINQNNPFGDISNIAYSILTNRQYILQFLFDDLTKPYFPSRFQLVRPLICRIMGVLLYRKPKEDITRIFYFKCFHDSPFEQISFTPIYPPYKVTVPVLELMNRKAENAQLDDLRWQLLCFIVSPRLTAAIIRNLPLEKVGVALTLFYLVENRVLQVEEADCFLLACHCALSIRDSLQLRDVTRISGRDVRLAFLFEKMYEIFRNCFSAVGLKEFYALLTFDGLFFHTLRKKGGASNREMQKMLADYEDLRLYSPKRHII